VQDKKRGIMPEFETEFYVYCSCGAGLCDQTTVISNQNIPFVTVEPCKDCLEKAKAEGRKEVKE